MADVIELLSELQDTIEKGFEIPFAKKTLVNKEQILSLINDINIQLPDELRVAKSIAEDSKRIISDAQKQADAKVKEVEHRILGLIDEHEITKKAVANANEIIAKAQKDGREIRLASLKFADDILEKVENDFKAVNDKVKQCRSELRK
ncbi:MAG: ATPase [Clostridia bacterium]|nr:ATPase [Clostridia bacterium]MBO7289782.1 ATPase [Clostridia bacterium]